MDLHNIKQGQKRAFFSYKQLFKGDNFEVSDLSKTISAMANTVGGKIWIGIKSEKNKAINTESKLSKIPNIESIKEHIQSLLMPEIPQLFISEQDDILSIEVGESDIKPHMFSNYKYYKRLRSKNVVMEEFEIRQLYQNASKANLQMIGLTNLQGVPTMSDGLFDTMKFYPRVHIQNLGQKSETLYKLEMKIPSALIDENFTVLHSYLKGYEADCNIYSISGKDTLFQGESRIMAELVLKLNAENYSVFEQSKLIFNLYSQEKVHCKEFACKEWFHYQGKVPEEKTFSKKLS